MRYILPVLLSALMIAQSMGYLIIYSSYQFNKAYIEATLCVDRDKPISSCHGSCHLKAELQKAGDETEQNTPKGFEQAGQWVLYSHAVTDEHALMPDEASHTLTAYHFNYHYQSFYDIFHPPKA